MNNTLKMVSALRYFNNMNELSQLEYLLITDDDTFVNIQRLNEKVNCFKQS